MGAYTTAKKHIRRSPYQAFSAVVIMFLTLLLSGMFSLVIATSALVLRHFESKPQITVFFTDDVDARNVQQLIDDLSSSEKTAQVTYVSKEEALAIYQEQNQDDPLLLEMVTADILPASLEVSATDPKDLASLEEIVRDVDGVEEVVYQKDIVDQLIAWTNAIRLIGSVLVVLLSVVSIFTIMTIVSLKIALKKDEIEILTLVGASPWYVRYPFLIEGGMYGVIGGVSAWVVIMGVLLWIRPLLLNFLGVIPTLSFLLSNIVSTPFLLTSIGILGGLVGIGILLGGVGSYIALSRFLRL